MTLAHADKLTRSGDARPDRSASAAQCGPPRPSHDLEVPGQDRGPHLAAMVAYYALLSLVPFMFLALSVLGFFGQISAGLVPDPRARPLSCPASRRTTSCGRCGRCRRTPATLGVIGLFGILWASLGFYSALESALNIVFRVQNRAFLHQKWVTFVLVMVSLVVLFASLLTTIAATGWVDRHVPHLIHLNIAAYLATMAAVVDRVVPLPARRVPLPDERRAPPRGRVAGRGRRDGALPDLVPGAPALPALLGSAARAAGVRRPGHPARLALPDGEHHRAGRRDQLVLTGHGASRRRRRSWPASPSAKTGSGTHFASRNIGV